jgi:hypothetical protein
MIASTRCRSQFGKDRGVFSSLRGRADQGQGRAGEERFGVFAGQALVGDDGGAGRLAGWRSSMVRACSLQHVLVLVLPMP